MRKPQEDRLTTLMQTVVETRLRLSSARERLRNLEKAAFSAGRKTKGKGQRQSVLSDYLEAAEAAQKARNQLLKLLREHVA